MMRRRITAVLAGILLLMTAAGLGTADEKGISWTKESRARLRVGNPTAMRGRFFTTMWGGTTSDLDAQDLLHGYSPVRYDIGLSRFRFDHSIVQDGASLDDQEGNRTYLLVFYDDLKWSDGTPITAADYAFSILLCMDPVIAETGGKPMDYSWITGAEEYLNHQSPTLSGLRIMSDQMLGIKVRREALPYFYELSRLAIHPYPAAVITPGITAQDDGNGAYLSEPLTAEMIQETVMDPESGYLTHPSVVSGPYTLENFDGETARFTINPYFKGTEEGMIPRIGKLEYTVADNADMIEQLTQKKFGLLNKVTLSESIQKGIHNRDNNTHAFAMDNYARIGLTELWFMESSPLVQDLNVRKAIANCFDREGYVRDYTWSYGMKMDAFCGMAQWMFRLASGQMEAPVNPDLPEEEYRTAAAAFDGLTLDGLTRYSPDPTEAKRLLEASGWMLNEQGIRYKEMDGVQTELRLTLGMPESEEAREGLEAYLIQNLEAAGIPVTIQTMTMDEIERAYKGETANVDMLYLGEDFSIIFDPEILVPWKTATPDMTAENSLTAAKAELYGMAQDMVRTEPEDLAGFLGKWIRLQERITETLPLLPVYSNVYFDFYSRELHNYKITEAVTWGEAIVKSYMSDAELPEEETGGEEAPPLTEEEAEIGE